MCNECVLKDSKNKRHATRNLTQEISMGGSENTRVVEIGCMIEKTYMWAQSFRFSKFVIFVFIRLHSLVTTQTKCDKSTLLAHVRVTVVHSNIITGFIFRFYGAITAHF